VFLTTGAVDLNATSALGPSVSGTVSVEAAQTTVVAASSPPPKELASASTLLRARCAADTTRARASSFVVAGPGSARPDPDTWLASVLAEESQPVPLMTPDEVPGRAGSRLAGLLAARDGFGFGVAPGREECRW
jgi:hypothetical protein